MQNTLLQHHIGTSGWSYYNWKGLFYPMDLRPTEWLGFYATKFNTVELNSSFYNLPSLKMIQRWVDCTPNTFQFSVKAWKVITHTKRLINCELDIEAFFKRIQVFDYKCAVILFQFPASFKLDLPRLEQFISILPKAYRYAFELRHPSWWIPETYTLLTTYNIAFCVFQLDTLATPRIATADFIYIRLHGPREAYKGKYDNNTLEDWKNWLYNQKKDAYIYLNNTMEYDYALQNARILQNI